MSGLTDVKGNPVQIDSYVEGFHSATKRVGKGRVFAFVGPGHVAVWTDDEGKLGGRQTVMYAGRYLVRDKPRPESKRTDVPDRLKR